MAYKIGYVDDAGSEGLAHWQMLDLIRRFACGYGEAAAPTFSGVGNGALTGIDTHPNTVTETWTITCTDATTVGAETWSVTGSVSGAQPAATTGVAFVSDYLDFTIVAGSTAFAVGDSFSVDTTAGALDSTERWAQMRYLAPADDTAVRRELVLKGQGLSGDDEIFVGLRCYQSVSADYYNMSVAGFTGYVDGNDFTAQPGYIESGIPAHNQRIDYWLAVNAQRIVLGLKVGTPVYMHGYVGKFLPYATPSQFPYPICVGGMLNGTPGTRYSDQSMTMPYYGNRSNFRMRFIDGTWKTPECHPWNSDMASQGLSLRDSNGTYPLMPIVLNDSAPNVYGELDGVYMISGFNNVTENTLTINAKNYVVLEDNTRTGFANYVALEMH